MDLGALTKVLQLASKAGKGAEELATIKSAFNPALSVEENVARLGLTPFEVNRMSNAGDLYHPIAGTLKLSKPVSEMGRILMDNPDMPLVDRILRSPEDMQGGVAIPFIGDRAATGKILTSIEGKKLKKPVVLEGGPDYMRAHAHDVPGQGGVWASDQGIVTKLVNQIRDVGDTWPDVFGTYVAMSPTAVDFNTMVTRGILDQMKPRSFDKSVVDAFNEAVRSEPHGRNFVGLTSPNLQKQLLSNSSGKLRKEFVGRAALSEFSKLGFPEVAAVRAAITEPQLLNVPLGSSGYTIAKVNPLGISTRDPITPHSTYGTQLAGEYYGGFDQALQLDVMFKDFFKWRRSNGERPAGDYRSFSTNKVAQPLDQEWVDNAMTYLERLKSEGQ